MKNLFRKWGITRTVLVILYHVNFNAFAANQISAWMSRRKKVRVITYMMTSSNGNIFPVTGLCEGNSPVIGEFTSQRPVTRSFDVFFNLRLNKRSSKQSRRRWYETPSGPTVATGVQQVLEIPVINSMLKISVERRNPTNHGEIESWQQW